MLFSSPMISLKLNCQVLTFSLQQLGKDYEKRVGLRYCTLKVISLNLFVLSNFFLKLGINIRKMHLKNEVTVLVYVQEALKMGYFLLVDR